MASTSRHLVELRELVLDEDRNVRWDAIKDRYFEKVGSSWVPSLVWTGSDRVDGDDKGVWDVLLQENILSIEIDGNYLILAGEMTANPRRGHAALYFVREEDAKAYVDLNYSRARFSVCIIKCQKVEKGLDFNDPQ